MGDPTAKAVVALDRSELKLLRADRQMHSGTFLLKGRK
jgi:hypothetical protein